MLEIVKQVHFETLFDVEWRKRAPIEDVVSEFVAPSFVVIHTHSYHSYFGNLCRNFLWRIHIFNAGDYTDVFSIRANSWSERSFR